MPVAPDHRGAPRLQRRHQGPSLRLLLQPVADVLGSNRALEPYDQFQRPRPRSVLWLGGAKRQKLLDLGKDCCPSSTASQCLVSMLPARSSSTSEVSQAGSPCKDVGLAIKTLSKRVAATRKHVVEHTACREDVHCACLGARETNMRRQSLLPGSLPDSILPQAVMLAKALVQTRTQGCFLSTISST